MRDYRTKLFFVVEGKKSNPEIFDNYEDACDLLNSMKYEDHARLSIAKVRNAYQEESGQWNYDDYSDTFEHVAYI